MEGAQFNNGTHQEVNKDANKENIQQQNISQGLLDKEHIVNDQECSTQKQKQFQSNSFIKFLEVNNWDVTSLQKWDEWEQLNFDQQKELESICFNETLMKEAQAWLKSDNSRQVDDILKQHKFIVLKDYKKFKRWISNQKFYQKSRISCKKTKESSEKNSSFLSLTNDQSFQYNKNIQMLIKEPLPSLEFTQCEMYNKSFKERSQEEWLCMIKKCEHLTYGERCQILKNQYFDDPIIFLEMLRINKNEQYFPHFFSTLLSIILQLENGIEKTNFFIASCSYYNDELLNQEYKDNLKESTIDVSVKRLSVEKQLCEINGFLKLIFINSFNLSSANQVDISFFLKECPLSWRLFIDYLIQSPFKIRNEVAERLPMVGQSFKQCIIQILKETRGFLFLKVPDSYRKILIDICIFCNECNEDTIKKFLQQFSDYIQVFQNQLEKADIQYFLLEMIEQLKSHNHIFQQGMRCVQDLLFQIIQGIIEGKIISCKNVISSLYGDNLQLNNELQKQKIIQVGGTEQIDQIIKDLKKNNQDNEQILDFRNWDMNQVTSQIYQLIQQEFGRPFHNIQIVCLKFVLSLIGEGKFFMKIGTGNGKTLITIAAAIIVCKTLKWSCIIMVKSLYLQYRDFKKYKSLIQSCGINASQQSFLQGGITFMEEKYFYGFFKNGNRKNKNFFEKLFVIIDEFDSLFDDSRIQSIIEKFKVIKMFRNVIGLTGSQLSNEENSSLFEAFQQKIITFPSINKIYGNEIIQRRSFIYTRQQEWIDQLAQIIQDIQKTVPVILVLDQNDISFTYSEFQKRDIKSIDLTELLKKQDLANLQTIIELQFSKPIDDQKYGVYIINSQLGRGTDFPTSYLIEQNGGNYLVLGDVFGKRITEQLKGRIGRMQNKGQFQYIVYMKQEGNIYDYIKLRENVLNLKTQTNSEQLINQIREQVLSAKGYQKDGKTQNFLNQFFDLDNNLKQEIEKLKLKQVINDTIVDSSYDDENSHDQSFILSRNLNFPSTQKIFDIVRSSQKTQQTDLKRQASQQIDELEKDVINLLHGDQKSLNVELPLKYQIGLKQNIQDDI